MASTYKLISSTTIVTPTNNVIFSSIPSTYTDLVMRMSIRDTNGGAVTFISGYVSYQTTGTATRLTGNGAAASSARTTASSSVEDFNSYPSTNATSNTFSNWELYIPNYATSMAHPVSSFSVAETNGTTAYINVQAQLISTGIISQLQFVDGSGTNFSTGSSFYLYGI